MNDNISSDKDEKKQIETKEEKIDLSINANPWALVFLFLFVAVLAFIIIGSMAGTYPFEIDDVTLELSIINVGLFVILLVLDLVLLMLGLYFLWFKKTIQKDGGSTESTEQDGIIFTDENIESQEKENDE